MHIIDDIPDRLQEAILATRQRDYPRAIKIFEQEQDAMVNPEGDFERMSVLSFYGLCIAMVWGDTARALNLCGAAARWCPSEPDMFFNLGMVQLRSRRRDLALRTFRKGLELDPHHPALCQARERLRRRRRPLFTFLSRAHPLNKVSGLFATRVLDLSIDEPI